MFLFCRTWGFPLAFVRFCQAYAPDGLTFSSFLERAPPPVPSQPNHVTVANLYIQVQNFSRQTDKKLAHAVEPRTQILFARIRKTDTGCLSSCFAVNRRRS